MSLDAAFSAAELKVLHPASRPPPSPSLASQQADAPAAGVATPRKERAQAAVNNALEKRIATIVSTELERQLEHALEPFTAKIAATLSPKIEQHVSSHVSTLGTQLVAHLASHAGPHTTPVSQSAVPHLNAPIVFTAPKPGGARRARDA